MRPATPWAGVPIRPAAVCAVALALAGGIAACGGDEEPPVPATASVVPADALFADAVVRPEGDRREAVEAALSKLLDTDDPGGFVVERVDDALEAGEAGVTYSEDVEPWLGEHAGLFLTSFTEAPDGAFVAEVTDRAAAADTVDKIQAARGSKPTEGSYSGVAYELDEEDTAVGFVDDFLVAGTESGFREAVDASQGESLAGDSTFRDQLETTPEAGVAIVYAEVSHLLDRLAAGDEISESQREQADDRVGAAARGPAIASIAAADDSAAAQLSVEAGDSPAAQESPLLRELPADSWLAFGAPDVGESLNRGLEQLDASGIAGSAALAPAVGRLLGTDPEDLAEWIGDVGGYASGTSIFEIRAGLSAVTSDEASSANALGALGRAIARDPALRVEPLEGAEPGFSIDLGDAPIQIVVAQRQGRVVAGLGERSVDALLEPDETLDDSEQFGIASGVLGSDYAAGFWLGFEPLLDLAEALGLGDDPDYQRAKPHLDHLDYLIGGTRRDGDQSVFRIVLGLR